MRLLTLLLLPLVLLACVPAEADEPEPFGDFLSSFCSSEDFRLQRTVWPLEASYVYEGGEGDEYPYVSRETSVERAGFEGYHELRGVDCTKDVEDWDYDYWLFDLFENFEADSTAEAQPDQRALRFSSDDSGLWVHYYFESRDGKWYLVRLEDDTI